MTRIAMSDLIQAQIGPAIDEALGDETLRVLLPFSSAAPLLGPASITSAGGGSLAVATAPATDGVATMWTFGGVVIPGAWSRMQVWVYCLNLSTAAGDVNMNMRRSVISDAKTVGSSDDVFNSPHTAGPQNQIVKRRVTSDRAVTPGLNSISIGRAVNSSDTLAGNYGLLALELERLS